MVPYGVYGGKKAHAAGGVVSHISIADSRSGEQPGGRGEQARLLLLVLVALEVLVEQERPEEEDRSERVRDQHEHLLRAGVLVP
jgi:hypothetical protein